VFLHCLPVFKTIFLSEVILVPNTTSHYICDLQKLQL
jgi:hypothetical protein